MDSHLTFKSTIAIASILEVAGTILAAHPVSTSTRNEKGTDERDVTAKKVSGSAVGILTDKSTLPPLPFYLQVLAEEPSGFNVLPSLYAKLVSHLAEFYATVRQKIRIIRREITNLTNEFISLSLSPF